MGDTQKRHEVWSTLMQGSRNLYNEEGSWLFIHCGVDGELLEQIVVSLDFLSCQHVSIGEAKSVFISLCFNPQYVNKNYISITLHSKCITYMHAVKTLSTFIHMHSPPA